MSNEVDLRKQKKVSAEVTIDTAGLSTEAKQDSQITLATALNSYVDGIEALLTTINSSNSNLDVALSTRATEATLALIRAKTDNLDVLLSTRSSETTLSTRLSESDFDTKIGFLTETSPVSDTASSGLNGRLQRIAQRITSLITAIGSPFQVGGTIGNTTFGTTNWLGSTAPTVGQKTMANSVPVVLSSDQSALPISGTVTLSSSTVNQGSPASVANSWTVKLTDGTNPISSVSNGGVTYIANALIQNVKDSVNNNSTANLAVAASFTGTVESTLGVAGLQVNFKSDQNCTLQLQQSIDGTNWDIVDSWNVLSNTGDGRTIQATGSFFRVIATNVGVATTTFLRLSSVLCPVVEALPRSLGSKQSQASLACTESQDQTFVLYASDIAIGNGKSMISIGNASGSDVKVKIYSIKIKNMQLTGVTGVVTEFRLYKAVSHSAGTSLTPLACDTVDSLNASVTARTNATITTEAANYLTRWKWSSDEWGTGASDVESTDHAMQELNYVYSAIAKTKPYTINANECIHIKQITNSVAGTFDLEIIFTQE